MPTRSTRRPAPTTLRRQSLRDEAFREYEFGPTANRVTYRIENPRTLITRPGGTTHRVVDAKGTVHCIPAPSPEAGVVLRWKARRGRAAVAF